MLTGKTITDEQIKELRLTFRAGSTEYKDCGIALQNLSIGYAPKHERRLAEHLQHDARERCAQIWNTVHKPKCPGREHQHHVTDVCEGSCCTTCGGPIDKNEECRC